MVRACAVVVLFAVSACQSFAAGGQPPVVSEPVPPFEPVAPPPEPVATEPVVEPPPPAPAAVELSALQAAIGLAADDPAVRELEARLGTPAVAGADGSMIHAFGEHGVALRFADGRVAEVALFAAAAGYSQWRGALPGGLRFGMAAYEVGRSVGVEIPLREVGRKGDARVMRAATDGGRTFRGLGVRVHFARGGLAVVSLLPVAEPGEVQLDDVIAYPTAEYGTGGLKVYYQLSVGAPAGCKALDVSLRIEDPAGAPIRVRGAPGRGTPEAFKRVDEEVPCAGADRGVFVPFAALDLPPGSHEVRLRVAVARAKKGRAVEARAQTQFTMPPVALVKLKVSRADINPAVFSRRNIASVATFGLSALFKRPKLEPDPFWVLEAGTMSHRSKVKSSTFSPRWSESTKWFAVAEGDAITLHFADEDLADNEGLGVIRVPLDQLRAAIRDGTPLSGGWVERVELTGSELREAP